MSYSRSFSAGGSRDANGSVPGPRGDGSGANVRRSRLRATLWVALGFVVLLAIQAAVLVYSWSQQREIVRTFERVANAVRPAEASVYAIRATVQQRILLLLRMASEPDPLMREADARAFEALREQFTDALAGVRALELDADSARLLEEAMVAIRELSDVQTRAYVALVTGDDASARALLHGEHLFEMQREASARLERLVAHYGAMAKQADEAMQLLHKRAEGVLLLFGGGAFGLGALLGVLVTRMAGRAEATLREARQRAEQAAHTDPLTGLLNRRGMELARRRRLSRPLTVGRSTLLLIDLDHFKPVNDTAGHEAGDALLRQLAELLRRHVRPSDDVVRLGGDEFAVVLDGLPADAGLKIAERIRCAIAEHAFEWGGRRFQVGASVGVCEFDPAAPDAHWREALQRADHACYRAKHEGRNRVVLADAAPDAARHARQRGEHPQEEVQSARDRASCPSGAIQRR